MKVLAFTDLHASVTNFKKLRAKIKKTKPDALLCCGDFTIFEQNMEEILEKINDFGVPCYLIHGNHESGPIVKRLCKYLDHLTYVHLTPVVLGKHTIVAHGGGGFYGQGEHLDRDEEFDKWVKRNKRKIKHPLIFLSHAPPAFTKLDFIDYLEEHVGCPSYTDFIEEFEPLLALSGHIHESFNMKQKKGKTLIANPGPEGTIYHL